MKKKKNSKLQNVVLILIGAALLLYLLITAVLDLTNQKDRQEHTIDAAYRVYELEHSINGLIPVGTDYYYIGIQTDTMQAYLFQAEKDYLDGKFDSDGYAISSSGVKLKGLVKKENDYNVQREFTEYVSRLDDYSFPNGALYIINTRYMSKAVIKLITFSLWIVLIVGVVMIWKKQDMNISGVHGKCMVGLLVLNLILSIICLV